MNTDYIAAFRTGPSFFFVSNEMSYSKLPDVLQIGDHAHAVVGSITLIQMDKSSAREAVTAEAVLPFGGHHFLTILNAANSGGLRFEMIVAHASWTCLLVPPKCPAQTAVHSARSNEYRRNRVCLCRCP